MSFTNWTAQDVAEHNARVRKENRIPDRLPPPPDPPPARRTEQHRHVYMDGKCQCGATRSWRHRDAEVEKDLHNAILDACARRDWVALHGSTAARTHRTLGEWDFVILADGGRVLLVEAKSKTGKLSPEQAALHAWAAKLGHHTFVVRSIEEFEEVVK